MRRSHLTSVLNIVLIAAASLVAACTAVSAPSAATPVAPALGTPAQADGATPTHTPRPQSSANPRLVVVTATPPPPSACAPGPADTVDYYAIGLLAPLSHAQAWPRAIALQAGASIALEEVNAAGGLFGKPVRLLAFDTQGSPELAAVLAEQLITEACVLGLLGGIGAETTAIAAVSEQYGVPFLVAETPDDALTATQPAALFRIGPTTAQMEELAALWLAAVGDDNGDGTVMAVMVAENSPAGDMAVEQANRQMPAHGIALETLRIDLPMEDFSPVIARIVAMEQAPDAIFLQVAGEPGLLLLQQLLDAGIGPSKGTLLVTGRAALESARFWQFVPSGTRTVVQRRGPWYTSLGAIGQTFLEKYQLLSSQWPEWPAFAGYDSLYLLTIAATQAASTRPTDLVAALELIDAELAAGRYTFPYGKRNPPDGVQTPDYAWHQWLEPHLLMLQYATPQQDASTIDVVWPPVYRTTDGPVLP